MDNASEFGDFLDILDIDFDLRRLAPDILSSPDRYYRRFKIAKRSGAFRVINSPYPSLAAIQQKILSKFLVLARPHECVYSFRKGLNAIQHASFHVGQQELLILDLEDFFGTVTRQKVFQVFNELGLSERNSQYASLFCVLNGQLPQGACTSPALSNLVFKRIDFRLSCLAEKFSLKYSRYADDMAFSGKHVPRSMPKYVTDIVSSEGFRLNERKTRLKIAGAKKIVTGVSISSGVPKAPRNFKRILRAEIHRLELNQGSLAKIPNLDAFIYERVLGRLNYLLQIEPDNEYALKKKILLSNRHQAFLSQSANFDFETIRPN